MGPRSRDIHPFNFEVYEVTSEGTPGTTLATADDYSVAYAAFEKVLERYAGRKIRLRNGARIVEEAVTGAYDQETKTVAVLERKR